MKYILGFVLLFIFISSAIADERQLMPYPENERFFIYPKNGQSEQQIQNDKFQCYQNAMKDTGFDPSAIPAGKTAPPGIGDIKTDSPPEAFDGDYGTPDKGYLAGEAKKEWKSEEVAKYEASKAGYNKAYKTCLENLGYTVN